MDNPPMQETFETLLQACGWIIVERKDNVVIIKQKVKEEKNYDI